MIVVAATACYLLCASLPGAAVENDPYEGAIQVARFSFENDQDQDFDKWPDDWTRRKGADYPFYVTAKIDPDRGAGGTDQSLRFDVNGGRVTLYSYPVRIDDLHSYVFDGYIRTQLLRHDAAILTLSFLNSRRERVQRFETNPVSGTHRDWVRVRFGPVTPAPDVRFAVIGCHLINDGKVDLRGAVWFDNLVLGKLPRMTLVSNYNSHFKKPNAEIEVSSRLSGLDQVLMFTESIDPDLWIQFADEFEKEQISGEVLQIFNRHSHPIAPSAAVHPHEDGGWVIADGRNRYLLLFENPYLEVYDANSLYHLHLQVTDSGEDVRGEHRFELPGGHPRKKPAAAGEPSKPISRIWKLAPQEHGFYLVNSTLSRNGKPILNKKTSFSVLDLVEPRKQGEFGWTIARNTRRMPLPELADAASQAGIRWMKIPLWRSMSDERPATPYEIAEMFNRLNLRGITPVGLLNNPPAAIREVFPEDWTGVSEVFTRHSGFWAHSLDPVVARFSSNVQLWQLGDNTDRSFIGLDSLAGTISNVKSEFDRIGRNTQLVVPWEWDKPLPSDVPISDSVLLLTSPDSQTGRGLIQKLGGWSGSPVRIWVELQALSRSNHSAEERGGDLAKKMVAAKIGNADGIIAYDVFDREYGLLEENGAPSPLFVPWRTVAIALRGAEFVGSFRLSGGSENYAFAHQNEVVLVIWSDKPTTEDVYLGENIRVTDIWGRQKPLDDYTQTGKARLQAGPTPLVIRGCSRPLTLWRLAVQFESNRLESQVGFQQGTFSITNSFPQGVSGNVKLVVPPDWQLAANDWEFKIAAGETQRVPFQVSLPANASLGSEDVAFDFEVSADRRYQFRVHRTFEVGLGDVELVAVDRLRRDGLLEIEQTIINKTADPVEVLDFQCQLYIPGRRRERRFVTKLAGGSDKRIYVVPGGRELRGKTLWIRAEQVGGRRVLNYQWQVGSDWDTQDGR